MVEPISTAVAVAITGLVKSAPDWLSPIGDAFLSKGREELATFAFDEGKKGWRDLLRLDEKERIRHLELALKNAAERGIAQFHTLPERDVYRDVIEFLTQEGPNNKALLSEALRLFALNETPDFAKLADRYHYRKRISALAQNTTYTDVDIAPYLNAFFNALVAELFIDPLFHDKLSDVIKVRAARNTQQLLEEQVETTSGMQRSLAEVVATLSQIYETLEDNYTPEQFEKDVQDYTEHVERTLRYLKLVGFVPKERGNENRDPELDGIFVPLRIALVGKVDLSKEARDSIVGRLERSPCMVLLGGPGSGKSTSTRHLAWSHAVANLSHSKTLTDAPLLSGKPLPLRIELRRLNEDRRQRPDYDFLTYACEVVLGRAGLDIPRQMFEVLLERRMMLVLFDGLDEVVATTDDRRPLVEEIEAFALRYPGNRFMVTSRPLGYELAALSEQIFSLAEVQPFDDEQIHLFLEHRYAHVLRLSPLSPEDQEELELLYTNLKDNPRLHDLAGNPLLLTVMTDLHHYERLPDKRILVYDRCAELLLEKWAKLKGTDARWRDLRLSEVDQYLCVAHLGFVLHKRAQEKQEEEDVEEDSDGQKAVDVPLRFLRRELEQYLEKQNLFPSIADLRKEVERFLDLIREEAGLIVERGTHENGEALYGFVHRTFQEYFAAADVYEQYSQEEVPQIVTDFLIDHLHDPHWSEVILLLLGKMRRKPASQQLRQILNGKSKRSQYANILQQDLFFISSCFTEEISVENDLAENVLTKLGHLVITSPFSSQQQEALETLNSLAQRRQYAAQTINKLTIMVGQEQIPNLALALQAGFMLFTYCPKESEGRSIAKHYVERLVRRPDLPIEQFIQGATRLYRPAPLDLEELHFATHLLFSVAQRPDLSTEHVIQVADILRLFISSGPDEEHYYSQLLISLAQSADLPIEQRILAAQTLHQSSPEHSEERGLATQLLFLVAQRPDLTIEQRIQAARALDKSSPFDSEEQRFAARLLSSVAQHPNLSREQRIKAAEALCELITFSDEENRLLTEALSTVAKDPNLPIEQLIEVVNRLYVSSSRDSEERRLATALFLSLAQHPNLPVEQFREVLSRLYASATHDSEEERFAVQMLISLIEDHDLPVEERIQAAYSLYQHSPDDSEESRFATQQLSSLARHPDLSLDQRILAAFGLFRTSYSDAEKRQFAIQMLFDIAQNQKLTAEQRLQAIPDLFTITSFSYGLRIKATQIALDLYDQCAADENLNKYWGKMFELWEEMYDGVEPEVADIPLLSTLAQNSL